MEEPAAQRNGEREREGHAPQEQKSGEAACVSEEQPVEKNSVTVVNSVRSWLCMRALPERAGWVEALDYEGWVGGGPGTGGRRGPVLRCCHPSLGLHSKQGQDTERQRQWSNYLNILFYNSGKLFGGEVMRF